MSSALGARLLITAARNVGTLRGLYDPDQPRDEQGQWTRGGDVEVAPEDVRLFHGTSDTVDAKKEGLVPGKAGYESQDSSDSRRYSIYLTHDFDSARQYAARAVRAKGGKPVIIEVHISRNSKNVSFDERGVQAHGIKYDGSIAPERVKVVHQIRSASRREDTLIHQAADAYVAKLSVALRYAFAMARRAMRPLLAEMRAAEFNEDQPRDERGRWTGGVGFSSDASERYPIANDMHAYDEQEAKRVRSDLRRKGRLNSDGTISLYHITLGDPESIRERGLVPAFEKAPGQDWQAEHSPYATYFFLDREHALDQLEQSGGGSVIEARIPITGSTLSRFVPDEDSSPNIYDGVKILVEGGSVAFIGGVPASSVKVLKTLRALGGPGSGNFGHAGRPGEVGGSGDSYHGTSLEAAKSIKTNGLSAKHGAAYVTSDLGFALGYAANSSGKSQVAVIVVKAEASKFFKGTEGVINWTSTKIPASYIKEVRVYRQKDIETWKAADEARFKIGLGPSGRLPKFKTLAIGDLFIVVQLDEAEIITLGSPDQPRDEQGQWTSEGLHSSATAGNLAAKQFVKDAHALNTSKVSAKVESYKGDSSHPVALVDIIDLKATEQGKGAGTKYMSDLVKKADRRGITLVLSAEPLGEKQGRISLSKLKSFYEQFGFKKGGGKFHYTSGSGRNVMIRYPKGVLRSASHADDLASRATDAMHEALEAVLPKTLLRALAAGGDAGLGMLRQLKHAEVAQDRAPGSEAISLHSNPEVGQGSAAPLASIRTAKGPAPKATLKLRFDASNDNAAAWAKKHAAELIDDITETSRKRIRLAVEELQEEGDWELAVDRVLAAVGNEDRANLIARHESHLAASEGQRQGWDQAVDAGLLEGGCQARMDRHARRQVVPRMRRA